MKYQTKSHATEQTNYGRLQQPGPLIEKGGIRVGANQEIECGSHEDINLIHKTLET